ncbi:MAG TPA: PilZ domain-containing protein [Terriglobales bacterium]|nr:PilZ domain-containing protein [Terriglobales bacterium]
MNQEWNEESLDVIIEDRRRQPRFHLNHVQNIRPSIQVEQATPTLAAKLVDISDGGVGVETAAPLEAGSFVSIRGELHSTRFCVGLQGRVRVAHCKHVKGGLFRVGLAFEGAFCRNIHCDHHMGPTASSNTDKIPASSESFAVTGGNGSGQPKAHIPSHLWGDLHVVPCEDDESADFSDSSGTFH